LSIASVAAPLDPIPSDAARRFPAASVRTDDSTPGLLAEAPDRIAGDAVVRRLDVDHPQQHACGDAVTVERAMGEDRRELIAVVATTFGLKRSTL
jgi:hypothetical protein